LAIIYIFSGGDDVRNTLGAELKFFDGSHIIVAKKVHVFEDVVMDVVLGRPFCRGYLCVKRTDSTITVFQIRTAYRRGVFEVWTECDDTALEPPAPTPAREAWLYYKSIPKFTNDSDSKIIRTNIGFHTTTNRFCPRLAKRSWTADGKRQPWYPTVSGSAVA
jgi:hypothetical protein